MRHQLPVWLALLCTGACAVDDRSTGSGEPGFGKQPEGWDADIRVAEAQDTDPDPHTVAVTLEARVVPLEVTPGVITDVWTYNGQLPGPTIRTQVGDRVIVTFTNALAEPTTVHWHGLRIPADMDGTDVAQDPVLPGGGFVYDFVVPDAGTFWYHPHVNSSAQMGFGLYGAFVVEDDDEPPLGDDLVLVLSDMGLDDDGQLLPGDHQGWFGDYFGRQGALSLVNGRLTPHVLARRGVPQRWRVVNASRSRYARFALPGHTLDQVGVDGGLLEHGVEDATVTLPPGGRADAVFVARGKGDEGLMVLDQGVDRFHVGNPLPTTPLFQVDINDEAPASPPRVPARLRTLPAVELDGAVTQEIEFVDVPAADGNTYLGINGQLYPDAEPMHAAADSTELWTVVNRTSQDHPLHLHGFFFEVLEVDGHAPSQRGFYDTFNIEPNLPVRLGVRFDARAGAWMLHCHIIDHADTGMMRMLMVE